MTMRPGWVDMKGREGSKELVPSSAVEGGWYILLEGKEKSRGQSTVGRES